LDPHVSKCKILEAASIHAKVASVIRTHLGSERSLVSALKELNTLLSKFKFLDSTTFRTISDCWRLIVNMTKEARFSKSVMERHVAMLRGARLQLEQDYLRLMQNLIDKQTTTNKNAIANYNLTLVEKFVRHIVGQCFPEFEGGLKSTFWLRLFYSLRCGMVKESKSVDLGGLDAKLINIIISDWERNGGQLSNNTSKEVSYEVGKSFAVFDAQHSELKSNVIQFKLAVLLSLYGCKKAQNKYLRDFPLFFTSIEDFIWFRLTCVNKTTPFNSNSKKSLLYELRRYLNIEKKEYREWKISKPFTYIKLLLFNQNFNCALSYMGSLRDPILIIVTLHIALGLFSYGLIELDPKKKIILA
jgi:nuclear pore complex protein Nup93